MVETERYLGLARSIAARVYRLMGGTVALDELMSQALSGLGEAASRYRPEAATPFGSFAQYRIRGAIFDWLRSMGYLQRRRLRRLAAPPNASDASDAPGTPLGGEAGPGRSVARAVAGASLGPAPDLGPDFGSDLGPALDSELGSGAAPEPASPPAPVPLRQRFRYLAGSEEDEDDDILAVCSAEPSADAVLAAKHTRSLVTEALHGLPVRERSFLLKHYFEDKTMTEAGAELGLSRYQSCRLHARVVAQLRAALAAAGFTRFEDV